MKPSHDRLRALSVINVILATGPATMPDTPHTAVSASAPISTICWRLAQPYWWTTQTATAE